MDKFVITGGRALSGEVVISGAKNAALPIILCTMLTKDSIVLKNLPELRDTATCFKLLEILGKKYQKLNDNPEGILIK